MNWTEQEDSGGIFTSDSGQVDKVYHYSTEKGNGLADAVAAGFISGTTETVDGVVCSFSGIRVSPKTASDHVFITYSNRASLPKSPMGPVGQKVIEVDGDTTDVDVGEAANSGVAWIAAAGNAAIARGETTVGIPNIRLTVREVKLFTMTEANIFGAAPAADPSAHIGTCTAGRWSRGAIAIRKAGSKAEVAQTWFGDPYGI